MVTAELDAPRVDPEPFTATRNACKLCAPLGACLAFRGVQGAVPFLHGSQGCSTYIRRYLISHFKEPVDIACSNFGETTAIFGRKENLRIGLDNVIRQYQPHLIGIATTCLAETIGDDVSLFLRQIRPPDKNGKRPIGAPPSTGQRLATLPSGPLDRSSASPPVVCVSTPSYVGSHAEGFHATVRALVEALAEGGATKDHVNLMPGLVSPADIRYLKEVFVDFGLPATVVPDYSDTLDGPAWSEYQQIPPGGTPVEDLCLAGAARATVEFGSSWDRSQTAGALLQQRFGVARHDLPPPVGVCLTDGLFDVLEQISEVMVLEDVDFTDIEEQAIRNKIDLIVGNSKGYKLSRKLDVPLIRVGFPVHDRIDGPRILHLGYRGAQQLFDRITNALIESKQIGSSVGYTYM
jgi:nitrogenase molybdenum-iron protein NifN